MRWVGLLIAVFLLRPTTVGAVEQYAVRSNTQPELGVSVVSPTMAKVLAKWSEYSISPIRHYRALYTPNDPQFELQWNFTALNMPAAWDATGTPPYLGKPGVIVAVLDTGVATTAAEGRGVAPDLASASIWTNPGETPGDSVDNDGNGLIDDIHGWDFINDDALPLDDNGHGTHIASIIAAGTNNATSTSGIASSITLLPLKVLDGSGNGTTITIAESVDYAVAQGADIINLSLGGTEPDTVLEAAINAAAAAGVIVVAASGNDGTSPLNYPAAYSTTLAVGATQFDNARAPYSNYGSGLDLMAPGGNTNLDQNADGYPDGIPQETCATGSGCATFATYYYSGTSQAAAHVSGIAALTASCLLDAARDPRTERATILSALTGTATDLGGTGIDTVTGAGLVNALGAIGAAGCLSDTPAIPGNLVAKARSTAVALSMTRFQPYPKPIFSWQGTDGVSYRISWGRRGVTPTVTTQTGTSFQPTISTAGTYDLSVITVGTSNALSPAATLTYRYRPPQLIVGGAGGLSLYRANGTRIRTLKGGTRVPFGTGGTINTRGDDRILLGRTGAVDFFRTSGSRSSTMLAFSSRSTSDHTVAVLRQAGASSQYAVTTNTASEVRIVDSKGRSVKRLIFGSGKLNGMQVASGDVDGDGTDEFVVADRSGNAIRLYTAAGSKRFTITPLGKTYRSGWAVTMGDVTGDGKAEILAIPRNARTNPPLYIIKSNGQVLRVSRLKNVSATDPIALTAVDLDGNGKDEITIFAPGKNQLTTWTDRGTKLGTIALPSTSALRTVGRLQ